jgi:hypothetical protein
MVRGERASSFTCPCTEMQPAPLFDESTRIAAALHGSIPTLDASDWIDRIRATSIAWPRDPSAARSPIDDQALSLAAAPC